ncbi:MAG: twin-arginine translocase subunit TatC [SAR324 cluster bacterium]|nr:twin-arginine translocase subunit TatC [SAR324 cluster bacterium]
MTESNAGNEINDPKMPLMLHLMELRKRMMISAGAVIVLFLVAFGFSDEILAFIQGPVLPHVGALQFDTLTDPFFTHLKASFFAALFVGFPIILSQIWMFVRPGLYNREKLVMWPFMLLSFPLFVGGGTFLYYIVYPYAIEFLVNYDKTLVPSLRVGDYLSFTVRLLIVFGLVFELPLISLFLTRMGMITHKFLIRGRRYAIVIIFLFAAVFTPPDVFTQVLLGVPVIILYEISIIVSYLARKRE